MKTSKSKLLYIKKWKDANQNKVKGYQKEYYTQNKKKFQEKHRKRHLSKEGKYSKYKTNAKDRNLSFNLTFEKFVSYWQQPCYYCGDRIKTIGLDRVDNKKGYTKDNIVPCCEWCNKMKWIYTREEFLEHCKKVINH